MYITRTQELDEEEPKYGLGVFTIEDEGMMNDLLQKLIPEETIPKPGTANMAFTTAIEHVHPLIGARTYAW